MMNKSYISETEEDHGELLFYLMNNIFDVFSLIKLDSLSSLLDENKVKLLILEIEPTFENITGPFELTLNDFNPKVRYTNFVNIITTFDKYFTRKRVSDKLKYTEIFNLKENIKVNELLKGDQKNLHHFTELFLLLCSITSQKDIYIDRVSECDERYLNGFLNIVEKYIVFNEENKTTNQNNQKFSPSTSALTGNIDNSKAIMAIEKLTKKVEDLENEKKGFMKKIHQNELEIEDCRLQNKNLTLSLREYESRVIDLERETEILKRQNEDNIKAYQETYQDIFNNDELTKQLNEKDLEIETINQEHKIQMKNYLAKISRLEANILNLQEKDDEYKSIIAENERLKAKNKEYHYFKDKVADYDELNKNFEKQKKLLDNLNFEKVALQTQLDKYNTEVLSEKEKIRNLELEKENQLYKIEELKNYIVSLKTVYDKKGKHDSTVNEGQNISVQEVVVEKTNNNTNNNLIELEREQMRNEIESTVEERTSHFIKEIEDLRTDKNIAIKSLREEIVILKEDKESLEFKIEELRNELKDSLDAKERLRVDKEKSELFYQKSEAEFKKNIFNLEKERDTIELDVSKHLNKLNELHKSKDALTKEFELLKYNYNDLTCKNESMNKERNDFINDYNILKSEMKMMKEKYENEILLLKEECQREKEKLTRKETELTNLLNKNINLNPHTQNAELKNEKQETITLSITKIAKISDNNKVENSQNEDKNLNMNLENSNQITQNKNDLFDHYVNSMNNHNYIISTKQSEQIENALNNLKNEIENMKINLNTKDDHIKLLNEKIRSLEKENKTLVVKMHNNLERFNCEIKQREEDLDFLRRAYDDQKNKLNREHDLISSSLYELALQFMTSKQELNKKNSPIGKLSDGNKKKLSNFSLSK